MRRIKKNCTALSDTYISAIRTIFFFFFLRGVGVVDSAVKGGVVEVVSSNLARIVNSFQHLSACIVDLLYLAISFSL